MLARLFLILSLVMTPQAFAMAKEPKETLVIFGASGRIGVHITTEAIHRDYNVIGVSRNPSALQERFPTIEAIKGDLLDRKRTEEILTMGDVVILSIGGKPTSDDPKKYIVYTAIKQLIEILPSMGDDAPRIVIVGNLFTLETEPGVTLLEAGRAGESNPNYPMFASHQLALDMLRESEGIDWTVASPPNGFKLKGRTGNIRWGKDLQLRGDDGHSLSISLEDYAYALMEEVRDRRYVQQRFAVAREPNPKPQ